MSSAPEVRHARAALFLSIGLGLFGIWGATQGYASLTLSPPILEAPEATGDAAQDAMARLSHAQTEIVLSMPHRGTLGAIDMVVSLMLVVGSFMLTARSKNATWWIRNATAANALYVVAETALWGQYMYGKLGALRPLIVEWARASAISAGAPANDAALTATTAIIFASGLWLGLALTRVGLQGLLYWRVGSEPVQGFIESGRS